MAFVIPKSTGAYSPVLNLKPLNLLKTAQLFCRHSLKDLKVMVYNGDFIAKPRSKPSLQWLECMDMLQEISKKQHMLQKILLNTSREELNLCIVAYSFTSIVRDPLIIFPKNRDST